MRYKIQDSTGLFINSTWHTFGKTYKIQKFVEYHDEQEQTPGINKIWVEIQMV